ncbi:MAG: hypothetical protein ACWA5U_04120 [bacterium]
MRVFPQKPQYILVSNNPSHQKRTNPFSRAEKVGLTVVVVLFLTYLVIFMQAVFNYFQHQQTQNAVQSRIHLSPNSVQQGHSLDNISQGYPSFVAIPSVSENHSVDPYKDFVENNDNNINADNVVQQLDKAISYQRSQVSPNTQLAKLDQKQDYPKVLRQSQDKDEKTASKAVTKPAATEKSQTTTKKDQVEHKVDKHTRSAKASDIAPSQPQVRVSREKSTESSISAEKAQPKPMIDNAAKTEEKVNKPAISPPKKSEVVTKKTTEPPRVSAQAPVVKTPVVKTEKTPVSTTRNTEQTTQTTKQTANNSQDSFSILEQSLGL